MLHLLDASMEQYLRGEVPLDDRIDVSYEAPDNEWRARITRPTINLFVWDIRRNQAESQGGMDLVERSNGRFHRPTPPRIDFRYLITTWTSEVQDEHSLLGAVLVACLRTPLIPVQYLQGGLAEITPVPRVQVARFDGAEGIGDDLFRRHVFEQGAPGQHFIHYQAQWENIRSPVQIADRT